MPVTLLIALVVAFGLRLDEQTRPWRRAETLEAILLTGITVLSVAIVALIVGQVLAVLIHRAGGLSGRLRRAHSLAARGIDLYALGAYAWIIHGLQWPQAVESGLRLRETVLADEALILAPYLAALFATWVGLYPAERALRAYRLGPNPPDGLVRHVVIRARQAFGLILPSAIVYALVRDLIRLRWPESSDDPYVQLAGLIAMGLFVLTLAPLFVRLTWPTRRLPDGPLRERLERLSRRLGFRFTDILVWDTGGALVNAGVTGAMPFFRYVLLTDALILGLDDPRQIEAVFGHEIGHVAHRHLGYFGFFFLGSMGVIALLDQGIHSVTTSLPALLGAADRSSLTVLIIEAALALAVLAVYFLLVFGYLSRRFERQADVYGCRAVSCDRTDCPPHADLDALPGAARGVPTRVCPVGIRIFADALANVAELNGMEPSARSWRHGSIRRRIRFLEDLEGHPDAERRFQAGIVRLRLGLAVVLVAALALAITTGAMNAL